MGILARLNNFINEVFNRNLMNSGGKSLIQIQAYKRIFEVPFDEFLKVKKEFASLKKRYGLGESACMAYCKFHREVFASSNLADIKPYCEANGIQYITTMDLLAEALKSECLQRQSVTVLSPLLSQKAVNCQLIRFKNSYGKILERSI
jgi:hypothetical protein